MSDKKTIAVIGLGYVGLPLAVEFGKNRKVIGFDLKASRIQELQGGHDSTLEVEEENLRAAKFLVFSADPGVLKEAQIYIVAVPTPIDKHKKPDLSPLLGATEIVGAALKKGDIVIYESTVYPGATEEDCVPVLEMASGLRYQVDFGVGYSPERINPGDKKNTLRTIRKITSGSTPEIAEEVDQLYREVVDAGTYKATSIKVAEAAKVVENAQRDINIAFINELAKICHLLEIDANEVVDAMNTKWNALGFRPGLVGGHCIGVDPFYLTYKAQELGYHPEIILAGRRLNDDMGSYVAKEIVKLMIKNDQTVKSSRILVLGITFKENCPDIRNSRVIDLIRELESFGCRVDVADPWADAEEVKHEYGIEMLSVPAFAGMTRAPGAWNWDAVVLAVAHNEFKGIDFKEFIDKGRVVYDVKAVLPKESVSGRL